MRNYFLYKNIGSDLGNQLTSKVNRGKFNFSIDDLYLYYILFDIKDYDDKQSFFDTIIKLSKRFKRNWIIDSRYLLSDDGDILLDEDDKPLISYDIYD